MLMLLPVHTAPLQLKLHGPYIVTERLGPVDYVISTPERRKTRRVCHVNLLRPYRQGDLVLFPDIVSPSPVCIVDFDSSDNELSLPSARARKNILSVENLSQFKHLLHSVRRLNSQPGLLCFA